MKSNTADSKQLDILGNGGHPSAQEILAATLKRWRQNLGYLSVFATVPAILVSNLPEPRTAEAKQTETTPPRPGKTLLETLNKKCSNPALLKRQSKFRLPHQNSSFDIMPALAGNDDCPGRPVMGGSYTAAAPYIEFGDTTGANNTVSSFYMYSFGYQTVSSPGPDHVYSFILSDRGPNPQIEVSTTSATYSPLIYVLQGGFAEACPAGTGRDVFNGLFYNQSSPGGTATINSQLMNFLPLNVPLYLFIDSAVPDAAGAGPYTLRMQDVTIAPPVINPSDLAEFFVRQHYVDFLSRQPDAEGFAFWTNQITSCGGDPQCEEVKRINVSAAYFLSIEFQETGYLVYRLYKAAYDDLPGSPIPIRFNEFMTDTLMISRNVIVGQAGWEQVLENNKRAFLLDFVQRSRFTSAFTPAMSAAEFVDKLNANAGHPLTSTERDQLASDLAAGRRSRTDVLRAVAENQTLAEREFNRAFVLMQYFGYLRRDPNDAPDGNFAGYDFWLEKLNRFNGNFVQAEMVKAFITSIEYRHRFE